MSSRSHAGALVAGLVLAAVAFSVGAAWWIFENAGAPLPPVRFDLSNALVPAADIVESGAPPGRIRPIDDPPLLDAAAVLAFNEEHRGKYLVPDDRVAGILLNGTARAYPLRVLDWHEVVNDEVGGIPVAVTRHPLSGSVAVFDRRVEGATLRFGASGLLLQSNLLLYDRREDGLAPSLWSQLQARAIAGPAADRGATLKRLPVTVARWEHWRRIHSETTVLRPDPKLLKRYASNPYGNYLVTGKLRYPAAPMPPPDSWPAMEPIVVGGEGAAERVVPLGAERFSERALLEALEQAGVHAALEAHAGPSLVLTLESPAPLTYSLWFAWYAQHHERLPRMPSASK